MAPRATRASWPVYLALTTFAIAMIGAMAYVLETGSRIHVRNGPRVDAVTEVKLAATLAHLWFEEILSGDRHESMTEVWRLLDRADWHTMALVDGGRSEAMTVLPVEEPALRESITDLRARLGVFRRVTEERWETRLMSAAGSPYDQQYDQIFAELTVLADTVERAVRTSIRRDYSVFRRVQTGLLAGGVLLSVLVAVVVARYLAQRDRAEEEVRRLSDRLTHVSRLGTLGEMATGIAHEVNQPLTAISTTAAACRRLLGEGRTDSRELHRGLDHIAAQALRAGDVIAHLRSLVRKETQERTAVPVGEVVRDAARLAAVDARLRGFSVRLDLDRQLPVILADPIQIQQVLLNLIRNGMEAMIDSPGPREVTVTVRRPEEGRTAEVAVVDRGIGLSDEQAEKLFTPFFTTKAAGLGLGLAISRSIIEAHGGRIWSSRNDGRGTTFHFTLPMAGPA
ncbi:hypothetical protein K8I85_15450 [bacterium]|nr:hypothetical protein [bacterium]